jgi:hypothetical protein
MKSFAKYLTRTLSVVVALAATIYVSASCFGVYTYGWEQESGTGFNGSYTASTGRNMVELDNQSGPNIYLYEYICAWSNTLPKYHDHHSAGGPFGYYINIKYWCADEYYQGRLLIQDLNNSSGYAEGGVYN